jgi:hypothetical protein
MNLRVAALRSSTELSQARAAAHLAIDRSRAAMAEADYVTALRWYALSPSPTLLTAACAQQKVFED